MEFELFFTKCVDDQKKEMQIGESDVVHRVDGLWRVA